MTRKQPADLIPFNRPAISGDEQVYLTSVFERGKFDCPGPFWGRCSTWLRDHFDAPAVLPTGSCTQALEMASLLCSLKPGDEVILPSFAYPSTGAAFVRCGASLVFVDIDPATMNIDPDRVEAAVSGRTKALVVLHYAGVACNMDELGKLAAKYGLVIIEDAAHAIFADYKGRRCGTLGSLGCISFHQSKNLHCGQGGALVINDPSLVERAKVILEKGTDRTRFSRGGGSVGIHRCSF